jgi:hypothetical protein
MKSTIREYADDIVDVVVVSASYRQSGTVRKFDMRTHFREGLVSGQDNTGGHSQI